MRHDNQQYKDRRLLPLGQCLAGLILLLTGVAMLYGGIRLITLDGSWYYAIAGIVLLITAPLLLLARRSGLVLYAGFCAATLAWALYECGWNPIALLPRVLFFLVLLIVMLLTWRWFARSFLRAIANGCAAPGRHCWSAAR
ncbi:Quinate/shikimate dehydrogenase (quinone) [compost metagenome]